MASTTVPRAVVFDLGKVLLDFDYGIAARRFLPRCAAPLAHIQESVFRSSLLARYETGLLTNEQFFREVQAATGFQGEFTEFREVFGDIFSPVPLMIELQTDLRRRGFPTYIFSNTNDLTIQYIREHFPFFRNFDGYFYSYQEGLMKPDSRFYEVLEQRTGQQGGELLYLDDRPENVAAGAARGWRSLLHETPAKTRAAVHSCLRTVEPPPIS